jgi:hypothetical protein
LAPNCEQENTHTVCLTSIDHPQIEGAYILGLPAANFIFLVCDGKKDNETTVIIINITVSKTCALSKNEVKKRN